MGFETLETLKAAFDDWRSKKRYPHEPMPAELLTRAREATGEFGFKPVVRATRIGGTRWKNECGLNIKDIPSAQRQASPSYSIVNLEVSPQKSVQPFAEVETPTGLKVRLFGQSNEALHLIASLCGKKESK